MTLDPHMFFSEGKIQPFFGSKSIDMGKSSRKIALFIFYLIIVSTRIPSATGEEKQQPFANILTRTVSMQKHSHQSSWEKLKTAIHEIQFRYFPPNLDFRGSVAGDDMDGTGAEGKMKKAVGDSFKMSKETFKGSAKSASEILGKATGKTVKKGQQSSASVEKSDAEL